MNTTYPDDAMLRRCGGIRMHSHAPWRYDAQRLLVVNGAALPIARLEKCIDAESDGPVLALAPSLLAALRGMRQALRSMCLVVHDSETKDHALALCAAAGQLIDKAEGRA